MKTLILMRHAKSDWSVAGQLDRERGLSDRGRRAAALMGAWLADEGHPPDAALVSSAVRTRQTWERLSALLPSPPDPDFRDDLYLGDPDEILSAVQDAPACKRLLVLGHNPGLAAAMTRFGASPRRFDAPTAAAAVYEMPIRQWRDADFGVGRLIAYEVPKGLV